MPGSSLGSLPSPENSLPVRLPFPFSLNFFFDSVLRACKKGGRKRRRRKRIRSNRSVTGNLNGKNACSKKRGCPAGFYLVIFPGRHQVVGACMLSIGRVLKNYLFYNSSKKFVSMTHFRLAVYELGKVKSSGSLIYFFPGCQERQRKRFFKKVKKKQAFLCGSIPKRIKVMRY